MSVIKIQNLSFTHEGSFVPVFENVNLSFDTDWKLGVVGRNGRGKTTFLQLLAGNYEYHGSITPKPSCTYFPFPVQGKERLTIEVLQEVCSEAQEWELLRELSLLKAEDCLYLPFCSLSSGEQSKALLAALFLREEYLLIDEPTNHLDAEGRQIVASYLKRKKGFLLVSHDRAFLDDCVDHILSINKSNIEVQSGNFSSWFLNFERTQAFELSQSEKLKREISKLSETSKRTTSWANRAEEAKYNTKIGGLRPDRGYIGHKAAKVMKRAKITEARQEKAIAEKSSLLKNRETSESLKLFPLTPCKERLLSLSDVALFYGERKITTPLRFELLRGERVALEGKNGSGKSTLLKLVLGKEIKHSGTFTLASGLRISYVPQTAESLSGTLSAYAREKEIDETLFKAILQKLGFEKEDFERETSRYSEGQKKKVLIAGSLCERAHLYLWDEPLNYLDLYARLQMEKLIVTYRPTMLFVEHDRAFQAAVATKVVRLTKESANATIEP